MKKIEENLTQEEFDNYCEAVADRMESETTYYGQIDEHVAYSESLQRRHIYGDEKDEHEVVLYEQKYDEETGTVSYDIYDELG